MKWLKIEPDTKFPHNKKFFLYLKETDFTDEEIEIAEYCETKTKFICHVTADTFPYECLYEFDYYAIFEGIK